MMEEYSVVEILPGLIGLPLLATIVTFLLGKLRINRWISLGFALIQLILSVGVIFLLKNTSGRYALGGWGAPLGIDLSVDGLSGLMILLTATIGIFLCFYSGAYFTDEKTSARFWPLWWLLMTGMNALFLAADAFNIYVTLEIIGLAAVALVALQESENALQAALRYLLASLLGSLFYLLGVVFLYRAYGTLDLAQLSQFVKAEPLSWLALAVITAGLLMKTALFPLHFWLPPAHSNAPAPVSAVLSGLVVKTTFYLLVRYWLETLAAANTVVGLQMLGILGAMAVLWGSWQAIRARRLKLIVAYSTVAQLGYLFLLFPLVANSSQINGLTTAAINAVVYFIIAHAFAKAAMFLAAGNIMRTTGHDHLHRLDGIGQKLPLSLFTFGIAGISLIGLPPSGGFIAKWLLLKAAIQSGQWWWALILLAGGLLAAVYVFRVLNLAFKSPSDTKPATPFSGKEISKNLSIAAFGLAVITVILGFNAVWVLDILDFGATPWGSASALGTLP